LSEAISIDTLEIENDIHMDFLHHLLF